MSKKAVSKAVIQVALVIGLVLAANAVRPFSFSNLALHTLSSARSLSFVLPEAAVERIEQATYLAQTFGKSFLDGASDAPCWPNGKGLKSDVLAMNDALESFDGADIKDVKPGAPAKKNAPVKRSPRRVRQESRNNSHEASVRETPPDGTTRWVERRPMTTETDSVAMVHPVSLPIYRPTRGKAYLTTAGLSISALPAKLNSCKTIEVKEVKLIALIQQTSQAAKLKIGLVAEQPTKISLQCREEEKTFTEEAGSVTEATSGASSSAGPEEEFFFEQPSVAPSLAIPQPECRRVP